MSMPRKTTLTCSTCGHTIQTTVFDSINTNYSEDVPEQILTNKLFDVKCPNCGEVIHLEYDMLYHDMKHDAMIWVVHRETEDYEKRIAEIRTTNIIPNMTTRIVDGMNALREKVACLEKNRDDRIIELCKFHCLYEVYEIESDFDVHHMFYTLHGEKELIFFYNENGESRFCELLEGLYELYQERYQKSPCYDKFDDNFPIVNFDWAKEQHKHLFNSPENDNLSNRETTNEVKGETNMGSEKLFCPHCGSELPLDSEFCQYCGKSIKSTSAPKVESVSQPLKAEKTAPSHSLKKPINKKLFIGISIAIVSAILLIVLVVAWVIPGINYSHAKNLLVKGEYELAYSEFLALGNFSNSEEMLLECRYVQAVKYRDAGSFDLANQIFESLGDYRDSKILIHNHSYKLADEVKASCVKEGSQVYKCEGCDDSYTRTITKSSHNYKIISTNNATCTSAGSQLYKCTTCDDSYTKTLSKTSHSYEITTTQNATCTSEGTQLYKCKTCSDSYSKTLNKTEHNYELVSTTNASCASNGSEVYKCKTCSDSYSKTLNKTEHNYALTSTIDSTCTTAGAHKYTCKGCGASYSEEISIKPHSYIDATCYVSKTCSSCGKTEGEALGHTDEAKCSRCGLILFETMTFSGTGSKVITNITLPKGNYIISGVATSPKGSGSFYLYLKRSNGNNAAYWIETFYSYKTTIENAEPFSGGISGGVIEIKVADTTTWTITIEAV